MIAYVGVLADSLLTHLKGRPLTLVRCPSGSEAHCFFQKHANDGVPAAIRRLKIEEESGERDDYMVSARAASTPPRSPCARFRAAWTP